MIRRPFNFTIALVVSLAIHAVLFTAAAPLWSGWLGSPARRAGPADVTIALQLPDTELPRPKLSSEPDMGEDKARGTGSNASEGERPMAARQAEDNQAMLSRNPRGPRKIADQPDSIMGPLGDNGSGGQQGGPMSPSQMAAQSPPAAPPVNTAAAVQFTPASPPPPAIRVDIREDQAAATIVTATDPPIELPKVEPRVPATEPARPAQTAVAMAVPQAPARPQTGDGRAPGVDLRPADPAQQSESISDPFSQTGSAVFRDGRLEIQHGRKFKITTRPHILLSGQADLLAKGSATVVLKLSVDATGKITAVDVIQSSGSNDIDQPCRIAAYDWWTEPSRDKQGRPVADVIPFTIRFE